MPNKKTLIIDVTNGVEGPCLCIGNGETGFRLAGPKPWGGGQAIHKFVVGPAELLKQLRRYAPEVFDA